MEIFPGRLFCLLFTGAVLFSCGEGRRGSVIEVEEEIEINLPYPRLLSDYDLFQFPLNRMQPGENVVEYEINSPLFSDYAFKKRFIYLPPGTQMKYHGREVFDFPPGAMIFKFFYYPADFKEPDKAFTILETRVLIREEDNWIALPYRWNEAQDNAQLQIAGSTVNVEWLNLHGKRESVAYSVPNINDCKSCHDFSGKLMPIGPTARQLNRTGTGSAVIVNQLHHFRETGWLSGLPDHGDIPFLTPWEDPDFELDKRARAYLEINCGHCHRPEGPAKTSSLHLMASVARGAELGIGKTPIAAGRGSGGLKYDIVPGYPEKSILYYRMESTEPGILMPEIGRKTIHREGLLLIKEWIKNLE